MEPGTFDESEELGARTALPAIDIRKFAEGFLIVEGSGRFERLP
jgi:hypothetical protein